MSEVGRVILNAPRFEGHPSSARLREPERWLAGIRCPTFVFEGTKAPSNLFSLHQLETRSMNPLLHFIPMPGETHFSVIAPLVSRIGQKIVADTASAGPFKFE